MKYLGLHIDSRLTFKKHIDYLAQKFWGRIHLAISLVGRRSHLSLENKVILYKQILRPFIAYGSPVWGAAATTHMKKFQRLPPLVQTILAAVSDLTLNKVTDIADRILEVSPSPIETFAVSNKKEQTLEPKLFREIEKLNERIDRFSVARGRSPYRLNKNFRERSTSN
ncbi:uncharacterized protein TNCV_3697811 [Trichonephila clavipes]|uniref:RNA-directed DNA polymerase from mobile element jockey n=1 Tax=Trichonephila clavipes TaxID=2585209 RepID=A0A8X6VJR9_TRICX|nr:uncharacterized protein TNCV_3697811 [Trichonephila clavipes]